MGKRRKIAKLVYHSGLLSTWLHAWQGSLTVLTFHRIGPEADPVNYDPGVYTCREGELRSICRWLSENASVLSEDEFLWTMRRQREFPPGATMITFDDGYIDNYTLAYPLLREFRLPATYYIPARPIEERGLGWWDLIAYIISGTRLCAIDWEGRTFEFSAEPTDRAGIIRHFHEIMKHTPNERTADLVQRLAETCAVTLPSRAEQSAELMTWDHLREVASGFVTIGSHTCSHRVLSTLSLEEQRAELMDSKAEIEARIGRPVRTLAYPVGGYEHFHQETKAIAQEVGYEAAFSFCTGGNPARPYDRFDVRRVSAPKSIEETSALLRMPWLFARRDCALTAPRPYAETARAATAAVMAPVLPAA